MGVDDLTDCSNSLDTVYIDVLEHLVNSLRLILELVDQCSQELD